MEKKFDKMAMVVFQRASGKIVTTMTAMGTAMFRLWALNNLTKSRDAIVFSLIDGEVQYYIEGKGKGEVPDITKIEDLKYKYVDDYCAGLLAVAQKEGEKRWS